MRDRARILAIVVIEVKPDRNFLARQSERFVASTSTQPPPRSKC
jgi:hypothetical protein